MGLVFLYTVVVVFFFFFNFYRLSFYPPPIDYLCFFINYNSSSHFMTYTRSTLLNETPCMKPFNLVLVMFTFRKEITDLHNAINVVYLKN